MTITTEVPDGFGVAVYFAGERATLAVRGELDLASASALGGFLDAVIASGYLSVVVDLRKLDFSDISGLRVISYAASRLVASGGGLTIRSPSHMIGRILAITELAEVVHLEPTTRISDRLGPEQLLNQTASTPPTSHHGLIPYLRRVSAVPADHDVVDGALQLVVALARATVDGADGVSVSLQRHGHLMTVAASDQTVSDMDADQYLTGEGPCVDASIQGRWFHAESLNEENRWPAFTPRAQALGINSILSSPLLAENRPVGALNIYSRRSEAFAPKEQKLASVFATEASIILTNAGVDVTDDQLSQRMDEVLRVRQVIALAQGVIMEREGLGEDGAYTVLRNFSQTTNRTLHELAEEVANSTFKSQAQLGDEAGTDHG
jgi:anti-anti-sigma factor